MSSRFIYVVVNGRSSFFLEADTCTENKLDEVPLPGKGLIPEMNFFFWTLFIYLREREGVHIHEHGEEQRVGERESPADSPLSKCGARAHDPEIMTSAKLSLRLNRLSHPGALNPGPFKVSALLTGVVSMRAQYRFLLWETGLGGPSELVQGPLRDGCPSSGASKRARAF